MQKAFFALILHCSLVFFIPTMSFAQNPRAEKWRKHLAYIKDKYPHLPLQRLDSITINLDSTAIDSHCFQFITNEENTKFIAFYLTERNSSSFNSIKREYGGTYRSFTWYDKKENRWEAFAYTVSGMYYKGKWYYDVGDYVEFFAESKQEAENIFLIKTLTENNFFVAKMPIENKAFWKKNEFAKNTYPYKEEYPNTPEVVIKASNSEQVRNTYNKNKKVEQIACSVSAALWTELHTRDSSKYNSRFKGRYMNDYCLSLYNADRNIVLLPIIYYDHSDTAHVVYYVLTISPSGNTLYKWMKFPEKEINREKGDEAKEVIYDIRTFIENWGWGTINMIGDNKFWSAHFAPTNLEFIATLQ